MKELNSKFWSSCLWSAHSFFFTGTLHLFNAEHLYHSIRPPPTSFSKSEKLHNRGHIYVRKFAQKLESVLLCADSFKYQFCSLLTAWKSASTLRLFWLQSQLLTRLSRRTYMLYNYKFYALNKTLIHQTWSMFPHLQVLLLFLPNI